MRIDDEGGVEYALQRVSDDAYLCDPTGDGDSSSWEDDAENATWVSTSEQAESLRDRNLLDESAVRVVSRKCVNEEDIQPDETDRLLDETSPYPPAGSPLAE